VTAAAVPGNRRGSETTAVILFPGDDGRLLSQLQGALVRNGYSVGSGGADANDNTLTALEAFQDNNGLPVQPRCDPPCRTALGLPDPQ
jgi:peptidoglycan hydrolase-like protein with peptidoglycan-binding domain